MLSSKNLIALSMAASFSAPVLAQDPVLPCDRAEQEALAEVSTDEVTSINAFIPAKPLHKAPPIYPKVAARSGEEGWVQMSYVIDVNGDVQDIVVDDSEGHKEFRRKALSAIKKWKFEPAIKDGKPIQQCHQGVQFDFTIEGQTGATRRFAKDYKEFVKLLSNGDIEKAEEKLGVLHEKEGKNRYENAWLWNGDAQLASKLGDKRREWKSLVRTIRSVKTHEGRNATFDSDYIANIHQRLFILNTHFGYYSYALKSAAKLKEMNNSEERYARIKPYIDQVKKRIASNDAIMVNMNIDESGTEFHTLVRNKFAFIDIQGKLETVEVRCESHREKFTVAEDHLWNIPASWGECRVLVQGQTGTTFDLVEVNQV